VVLVLVGITSLMVGTAKVKRMSSERQKAIELSQSIIEEEVSYINNNKLKFWSDIGELRGNVVEIDSCNNNDSNYSCYVKYGSDDDECDDKKCNLIFTVKWGDPQEELSVERFFLREGL